MICLSRESYIIVYASSASNYFLFSYSINGKLLDKVDLNEKLFCMCMSEDGRVLLTGGERCLVVMRWAHNLQLANDGPRQGQEAVLDGREGDQESFMSPIRSIHLNSKERQLIVGLDSGEMRVLAQVLTRHMHSLHCGVVVFMFSPFFSLFEISQDSEYLRKRLVSNLEDIGLITSTSAQGAAGIGRQDN
jgi:hypothetical protein